MKYFILLLLVIFPLTVLSQNAYFIDGYHGGVYGHYPNQYTRFLVDMFKKNPDWKISLEIEPETWDTVRIKEPEAYLEFRDLVLNPQTHDRIEFTNPSFGQGYLYNISGESVIRQFTFGMERLYKHFPGISFTTYAVEEPCFTSCLPQVLKSLGFKYAVIRCPNTCWGGYPRNFGGELVNWVGPDGTRLISVPRYACEDFQENSTWQTASWNNSVEFINACFSDGIKNPVGMTYQDAGWRGGPWLGNAVKDHYSPSVSETWHNYIENRSIKIPEADWKFSQEDLQVSLVWGSQVLQKLAQQVRKSENLILQAEKFTSIASVFEGMTWPESSFDEAWRTLLLSQHHDCWIVPYNGRPGNTWADKVASWTEATNIISEKAIDQSAQFLSRSTAGTRRYIRVLNSTGSGRKEFVSIDLPAGWDKNCRVLNRNKEVLSQVITNPVSGSRQMLFEAEVPSAGYATFLVQNGKPDNKTHGANVLVLQDGTYKIETDLYRIIIDPAKGGTIKSLIAKKLKGFDFIDQSDTISFNELRGNFFNTGGLFSSSDNPAKINIIENGPAVVRIEIKNSISGHPFTQVITVIQGQRRIDCDLKIDWVGNPGIGNDYSQTVKWQQTDRMRAFYNNREKILLMFPLKLKSQRVYVNAPFDVTESRLDNTFFTRWDSIKNDIVLNWVDFTDASCSRGMAIFSDHTTSYAHGSDFPPALTVQYSGIGLWGRNYSITGPTEIHYCLVPHSGKWDQAKLWTESVNWSEPLRARIMDSAPQEGDSGRSLIDATGTGFEVSSMTLGGKDLYVRFFNAEGDNRPAKISFNFKADRVEMVELDNRKIGEETVITGKDGRSSLSISIPKFGIRTLKFINVRTHS